MNVLPVIPLELGEKWINKLWRKLDSARKARRDELNEINDYVLFSDPLKLAEVYIEPFCQEVNPADRHDEDFFAAKEPLFKKVSEFLRLKTYQQGNNQLFILSDAGMGKTSCLVMLKLLHLTSLWPKGYKCVLEKLNETTLERLSELEERRNTVLLLDSLDEDPSAYGRVHDRLLEILDATKSFNRVIITCRTQFFPETESDPMEVPGRVKLGPYVCPSKYLSLFDDSQVDSYLLKRFPRTLWKSNKEKISKAKAIVGRMRSLRCRPMLLSFIEDLVLSAHTWTVGSEYSLYHSLVQSWLVREESKTNIKSELLFKVCAELAFEMQARRKVKISAQELNDLIENIADLGHIKAIDITGRSLLNRNSDGDYRFSHYSIQEYLVVYYILNYVSLTGNRTICPTDFIKNLLEAHAGDLQIRLESEKIIHFKDIEATDRTRVASDRFDFLGEQEVERLMLELVPELDNFTINAFEQDLDVPTYMRRVIARSLKRKRIASDNSSGDSLKSESHNNER